MAATTDQSAPATAIRPFTVEISQSEIDDLREQAHPDLVYSDEPDRGNHFATWQEPELFTSGLRAAFRSPRSL